jgi:hypothetical protein
MEEVCERENLKEALRRVKANKGSAGVDGMTVDRNHRLSETALASHPGTTVERDLRAEAGEAGGNPQAGRRGAKAWHPDGAGSIYPAGGDAGSAEAVGPDVFRNSYGFRPGRSAHQAVAQAQQYIAEGHGWCVDLDLEKFFDRVNHDKLMGQIAKRVEDKRLLKLIRAFLNAGVMENGLVSPSVEGTPQGRLNRARDLLRKVKHLPDAVERLTHDCSISPRQAYRYLQQAQRLKEPVAVAESKVAFTVKLRRSLIQRVRLYASVKRLSISEVVNRALLALLPRGRGRG